ncbi:hypothetical protein D3C84_744070 [compost metagenome]
MRRAARSSHRVALSIFRNLTARVARRHQDFGAPVQTAVHSNVGVRFSVHRGRSTRQSRSAVKAVKASAVSAGERHAPVRNPDTACCTVGRVSCLAGGSRQISTQDSRSSRKQDAYRQPDSTEAPATPGGDRGHHHWHRDPAHAGMPFPVFKHPRRTPGGH